MAEDHITEEAFNEIEQWAVAQLAQDARCPVKIQASLEKRVQDLKERE